MYRIPRLILVFFGFTIVGLAQEDSTYYYFNRATPEKNIASKMARTHDPVLNSYYKLVYFSRIRDTDSIEYYLSKVENAERLPQNIRPRFLYLKAYYFKILDNDSLAFKYHNRAFNSAVAIKDTLTILHSLSGLSQEWDYKDQQPYRLDQLQKLKKAADLYNNNSFKIIHNYLKGNYYLFRERDGEAIKMYKRVLTATFIDRDSLFLLNTYNNLGALYQANLERPDSAIYYFKKKLELIKTNSSFSYPENYFDVYTNLGRSYTFQKDYKNALLYLKKADSLNNTENIIFNKLLINENLAEANAGLFNFEKAFYNLKNVIKLSDSLKEKEHQKSITNIIENYDNKTLKSNLLQKEIQQRNLWLGATLSVIALSLISYLIYKNTKRKQRIAEQQREIEIQKTEKILKEQELTTIDAMIAGQEKERERLAGDLHDSVGATLTAAKLQFDHLKNNKGKLKNEDELFEKTSNLLENAYTEIRNMAHLKNSGVMAKNGLLPAIEKLAKNASATTNLSIDVQDFGLDERIENSLEIAVFRIIQELVTNIIKHSKATEATISITKHRSLLSIIVEDNGKGFNTKKIYKQGMGLANIERRVEHLEGSMDVDSTKGKGTTVIIDIPL